MSLKTPDSSEQLYESLNYDTPVDIEVEAYETLLEYEESDIRKVGDKDNPTVFVSIYSGEDRYSSNFSARAIYNEESDAEPHLSVTRHEAVDGVGTLEDLGPVLDILEPEI